MMNSTDYKALSFYADIQRARQSFWHYCNVRHPKFFLEDRNYIKDLCATLEDFYYNDTQVLIINMPPRTGKSFTSSQFVEWVLGKNPKYKIMLGTYNETLSTSFSTSVRDTISEQKANPFGIVYNDIFPNTKIKRGDGAKNLWRLEGSPVKNYLATSPTGSATGFGADMIIIDDVIKNAMEANNTSVLAKLWSWLTDTMFSRLEGANWKLLIVMTQWATNDIAHKALEHFTSIGVKVKQVLYNAVKEDGTMLDERIISREKYEMLRSTLAPNIFEANYNNKAIDLINCLFSAFKTYKHDELPNSFERIVAQTDTADEGDDYLCQIIAGRKNNCLYVLDVYMTQEGMEKTERESAKRITQYKVNYDRTESNNGGRGFARNKERICREVFNNTITRFIWKATTSNKVAKILTNCTGVTNTIILPSDWATRWSEFYNQVTLYSKSGVKQHDDGVDCLTELYINEFEKPTFKAVGGIRQ